MRAEYKRDMNHNYLILHSDQEVDTTSYQVRMLAGNTLPSILKCRLQSFDGEIMFYYEITSRQSISSLYEQKKFKMEDLQLILGAFVQVMEEMGEYLLNPGQLVLDPDYIFLDVEKKNLYFCYLPGYGKEVQEQFRTFTEYILPKLDHEDARAVMLGYGVYRSALEDSFHLENIKKELYQVREEISLKTVNPTQRIPNEEFPVLEEGKTDKVKADKEKMDKETDQQLFDWERQKTAPETQKENRKLQAGLICGAAVTVAAMLGVLAANLLGYLPWLSVEIAMGTGLVLLGTALLVYFLSGRKKIKEQKNLQEELKKNKKVREKQEAILGSASFSEELPKNMQESEKRQIVVHSPEEKERAAVVTDNFGETTVLSANTLSGPASFVSREPGELATIYLTGELTIIGKLENACDAVIPLPTVSRVHAKIRKKGEDYYLTDLNSRNGTSVNGRMLKGDEEYCLQEEDEVDFAQARYVFLK